ncbi:hypothetical protein [Herbaspirillum sp. C9C3]|uniref:hypothetical protein n=1 Tax=Herbaspirillum sp. C9C3 TaxID=2735271 RepID=UPI001584DEB2|nr:hypothetical protein [Herbaspirillum sp. C9C3]NUT60117.1 hypothetical protein [Herbaspirillum sp. C9C3]
MNKTHALIALLALMLTWQAARSERAVAANAGALDISVVVAEKCRIDFSEGSADFFQVCSIGQSSTTERTQQVMGANIALSPQDDPYFLERDPERPGQVARVGDDPPATDAAGRRGPKVVVIPY